MHAISSLSSSLFLHLFLCLYTYLLHVSQNLYATAMLHDAIWMYAAAAELAVAAGDSVQNAMDYTPSVNFTGMLFTINQVFNSVYTECNLAHPAHSYYLP